MIEQVILMAQAGYSKAVMEHFMNPRNVGVIEDPDGYGKVGNPVCGDLMEIFIKVKDDRIDDIKFRTFGCGSAIAVSSKVTEMAKGKTLEEAMKITRKDVAEELDGLPPQKMHCSNLGADALHAAIESYWVTIGKMPPREAKEDGSNHDNELVNDADRENHAI
ncbi:MAG TPA: Fe-S cluster assembly scaffold protein NifU [Methanotrichaceae archaeon]|nr:Fe-S cluster assembly scaffold protein NifU [Methanotrichaceae archaeon]